MGSDRRKKIKILSAVGTVWVFLLAAGIFPASAVSESCETAVQRFNRQLLSKIDEGELVLILRALNASGSRRLPVKFVTKREAERLGWRPGADLWASSRLKGKSIGGDRFQNFEKKLPNGRRIWREADLAYRGGRRGAKRIVFSEDGLRRVTIDHYKTFQEVPPCR